MKFLKQYLLLLKKAKTDIEAAKILYKSENENIDSEIVLFHLQQSTEKIIKSLLIYNKIEVPRTHDIEKLLKTVTENSISIDSDIEELKYLSDFAVGGRYDFIREVVNNVDEKILLVENLFTFVKKQITRNEIK